MTYAGNSIFSSPQSSSTLDDIITTFEKIYDEFTSSESPTRRYSTPDQRPDNDDVFDKNSRNSFSIRHSKCGLRSESFDYGSSRDFVQSTINTFNLSENRSQQVIEDNSLDEPVIYRSSLVFSPKCSATENESSTLSYSYDKIIKCQNVTSGKERVETSSNVSMQDNSEIQNKRSVVLKPNLPTILKLNDERNPSKELEIVKNILHNLDFKKYRRRHSFEMEEKSRPNSGRFLLQAENSITKGLFRSLSFTNALSEERFLSNNESSEKPRRKSMKQSCCLRDNSDEVSSSESEKSHDELKVMTIEDNHDSSVSKSPLEQRRYSKRRLRGPYGEMLEEEMRKSGEKQKFAFDDLLQEINQEVSIQTMFTSSHSLESDSSIQQNIKEDTRTHVVTEIYETEKSYVDSLYTLVNKYMKALKSSDYCGIVDGGIVDEIFFQIPEILSVHEEFLDIFTQRYNTWDVSSTVGDLFVETFTKQQVIDTYTSFINNWKCAKEATKVTSLAKPVFARFLEHMSREHKGKLALDALLIMPVQRIPRYELLIKELLKHTNIEHSDYNLLVQAQKEVHELAVKINQVEREAFQQEILQQKVREIEQYIAGIIDLVQPDREFIRHDTVTIPGSLGTKKERCLFLFSDLMVITTIKKKTIRKPSIAAVSSSQNLNVLEMNKYKYLTRFPLDSLDISKSTNINLKRALKDIKNLEEDIILLKEVNELIGKLNTPHQVIEDAVKDLSSGISKQLLEKQNNDLPLICLELAVTTA